MFINSSLKTFSLIVLVKDNDRRVTCSAYIVLVSWLFPERNPLVNKVEAWLNSKNTTLSKNLPDMTNPSWVSTGGYENSSCLNFFVEGFAEDIVMLSLHFTNINKVVNLLLIELFSRCSLVFGTTSILAMSLIRVFSWVGK